jgi:hypothetical protein
VGVILIKKWIDYTEEHPYSSIIIAVIIGSVIGISIEYLINKDIQFEGLFGVIIVTFMQLRIVKKSKK